MTSKIKRKKECTSILDRFQRDETFHERQLARGWTEGLYNYLDSFVKIDISHHASPEQRARHNELNHLRYASDNLGPMNARPDYHMATLALISKKRSSAKATNSDEKS